MESAQVASGVTNLAMWRLDNVNQVVLLMTSVLEMSTVTIMNALPVLFPARSGRMVNVVQSAVMMRTAQMDCARMELVC